MTEMDYKTDSWRVAQMSWIEDYIFWMFYKSIIWNIPKKLNSSRYTTILITNR